jgi:hypothetical protein
MSQVAFNFKQWVLTTTLTCRSDNQKNTIYNFKLTFLFRNESSRFFGLDEGAAAAELVLVDPGFCSRGRSVHQPLDVFLARPVAPPHV